MLFRINIIIGCVLVALFAPSCIVAFTVSIPCTPDEPHTIIAKGMYLLRNCNGTGNITIYAPSSAGLSEVVLLIDNSQVNGFVSVDSSKGSLVNSSITIQHSRIVFDSAVGSRRRILALSLTGNISDFVVDITNSTMFADDETYENPASKGSFCIVANDVFCLRCAISVRSSMLRASSRFAASRIVTSAGGRFEDSSIKIDDQSIFNVTTTISKTAYHLYFGAEMEFKNTTFSFQNMIAVGSSKGLMFVFRAFNIESSAILFENFTNNVEHPTPRFVQIWLHNFTNSRLQIRNSRFQGESTQHTPAQVIVLPGHITAEPYPPVVENSTVEVDNSTMNCTSTVQECRIFKLQNDVLLNLTVFVINSNLTGEIYMSGNFSRGSNISFFRTQIAQIHAPSEISFYVVLFFSSSFLLLDNSHILLQGTLMWIVVANGTQYDRIANVFFSPSTAHSSIYPQRMSVDSSFVVTDSVMSICGAMPEIEYDKGEDGVGLWKKSIQCEVPVIIQRGGNILLSDTDEVTLANFLINDSYSVESIEDAMVLQSTKTASDEQKIGSYNIQVIRSVLDVYVSTLFAKPLSTSAADAPVVFASNVAILNGVYPKFFLELVDSRMTTVLTIDDSDIGGSAEIQLGCVSTNFFWRNITLLNASMLAVQNTSLLAESNTTSKKRQGGSVNMYLNALVIYVPDGERREGEKTISSFLFHDSHLNATNMGDDQSCNVLVDNSPLVVRELNFSAGAPVPTLPPFGSFTLLFHGSSTVISSQSHGRSGGVNIAFLHSSEQTRSNRIFQGVNFTMSNVSLMEVTSTTKSPGTSGTIYAQAKAGNMIWYQSACFWCYIFIEETNLAAFSTADDASAITFDSNSHWVQSMLILHSTNISSHGAAACKNLHFSSSNLVNSTLLIGRYFPMFSLESSSVFSAMMGEDRDYHLMKLKQESQGVMVDDGSIIIMNVTATKILAENFRLETLRIENSTNITFSGITLTATAAGNTYNTNVFLHTVNVGIYEYDDGTSSTRTTGTNFLGFYSCRFQNEIADMSAAEFSMNRYNVWMYKVYGEGNLPIQNQVENVIDVTKTPQLTGVVPSGEDAYLHRNKKAFIALFSEVHMQVMGSFYVYNIHMSRSGFGENSGGMSLIVSNQSVFNATEVWGAGSYSAAYARNLHISHLEGGTNSEPVVNADFLVSETQLFMNSVSFDQAICFSNGAFNNSRVIIQDTSAFSSIARRRTKRGIVTFIRAQNTHFQNGTKLFVRNATWRNEENYSLVLEDDNYQNINIYVSCTNQFCLQDAFIEFRDCNWTAIGRTAYNMMMSYLDTVNTTFLFQYCNFTALSSTTSASNFIFWTNISFLENTRFLFENDKLVATSIASNPYNIRLGGWKFSTDASFLFSMDRCALNIIGLTGIHSAYNIWFYARQFSSFEETYSGNIQLLRSTLYCQGVYCQAIRLHTQWESYPVLISWSLNFYLLDSKLIVNGTGNSIIFSTVNITNWNDSSLVFDGCAFHSLKAKEKTIARFLNFYEMNTNPLATYSSSNLSVVVRDCVSHFSSGSISWIWMTKVKFRDFNLQIVNLSSAVLHADINGAHASFISLGSTVLDHSQLVIQGANIEMVNAEDQLRFTEVISTSSLTNSTFEMSNVLMSLHAKAVINALLLVSSSQINNFSSNFSLVNLSAFSTDSFVRFFHVQQLQNVQYQIENCQLSANAPNHVIRFFQHDGGQSSQLNMILRGSFLNFTSGKKGQLLQNLHVIKNFHLLVEDVKMYQTSSYIYASTTEVLLDSVCLATPAPGFFSHTIEGESSIVIKNSSFYIFNASSRTKTGSPVIARICATPTTQLNISFSKFHGFVPLSFGVNMMANISAFYAENNITHCDLACNEFNDGKMGLGVLYKMCNALTSVADNSIEKCGASLWTKTLSMPSQSATTTESLSASQWTPSVSLPTASLSEGTRSDPTPTISPSLTSLPTHSHTATIQEKMKLGMNSHTITTSMLHQNASSEIFCPAFSSSLASPISFLSATIPSVTNLEALSMSLQRNATVPPYSLPLRSSSLTLIPIVFTPENFTLLFTDVAQKIDITEVFVNTATPWQRQYQISTQVIQRANASCAIEGELLSALTAQENLTVAVYFLTMALQLSPEYITQRIRFHLSDNISFVGFLSADNFGGPVGTPIPISIAEKQNILSAISIMPRAPYDEAASTILDISFLKRQQEDHIYTVMDLTLQTELKKAFSSQASSIFSNFKQLQQTGNTLSSLDVVPLPSDGLQSQWIADELTLNVRFDNTSIFSCLGIPLLQNTSTSGNSSFARDMPFFQFQMQVSWQRTATLILEEKRVAVVSPLITEAPLPLSQVIPIAVEEVTENVVVGTALGAGVLGNPGLAMQQIKMNTLQQLSQCDYSHTEALDSLMNPTGFHFGVAHGAYYRGAVLGNAMLFVGMVLVFACAGMLLHLTTATTKDDKDRLTDGPSMTTSAEIDIPIRSEGEAQSAGAVSSALHQNQENCNKKEKIGFFAASFAKVTMPSLVIVPSSLCFQGTIASSIAIFIHSTDALDILIGIFGVMLCFSILGFMFYITVFDFHCGLQRRSMEELEERDASIWKKLMMSEHHWVANTTTRSSTVKTKDYKLWKKQHLLFFADYRFPYVMVVELALSGVMGVVDGIRISTDWVCAVNGYVCLILFLAFFIFIIYKKPALSPLQHYFTAILNFFGIIGSICLVIGIQSQSAFFLKGTSLVSFAVMILGIGRFGLDMVMALQWMMARTSEIKHKSKGKKDMHPSSSGDDTMLTVPLLPPTTPSAVLHIPKEEEKEEREQEASSRSNVTTSFAKNISTKDAAIDFNDQEMDMMLEPSSDDHNAKNIKKPTVPLATDLDTVRERSKTKAHRDKHSAAMLDEIEKMLVTHHHATSTTEGDPYPYHSVPEQQYSDGLDPPELGFPASAEHHEEEEDMSENDERYQML